MYFAFWPDYNLMQLEVLLLYCNYEVKKLIMCPTVKKK